MFRAIVEDDEEMLAAHAAAANSMPKFLSLLQTSAGATSLAKLRFRDPDLSDQIGTDVFFYLWLTDVVFHSEERMLSGVFFEIPAGFENGIRWVTALALIPKMCSTG